MRIFTFSQARQQLATVLDEASREGKVQIRRRDGRWFVVLPVVESGSQLDVPAVSTALTTAEILALVREGRRPRRADQDAFAPRKSAATGRRKKPRAGSTSR